MSFIETTDKQGSISLTFLISSDSWENNIATIHTSVVYPRSIIFISPDVESLQIWRDCCVALYNQSYNLLTFKCSKSPNRAISGTILILNDFYDYYESNLEIVDNYGNKIIDGSTISYGNKDTISLYIQTNRPGEIIAYTDNSETSIKIFDNNLLIISTSDLSKRDRVTVKQRECNGFESDVFIFYTEV